MAKLYVVGIGPGAVENMTLRAVETIKKCDVIVGYTPYLEYISEFIEGKELFKTGMRGEIERCKKAIEYTRNGKDTAIISTGDAGLYGMAGPILELAEDIDVEVIPGVTAAFSAASELGSPIMHDYSSISLSDLLTPWDVITKRAENAAKADMVITLYNPRSKGRPEHLNTIIEIISKYADGSTPVGAVKNSGRANTEIKLMTLDSIEYEFVDMLTVLIIGNSKTYIKDGKMITPRGYENKWI
ncbi:MAG: precorrin-3B C(17)-methyltransferase [Tissierellia bacterium]|nr:precorrin-3B C(17)-methyltransferase [Tissierellia bacterium]